MTYTGLTLFEERHMISILLYVSENEGCMKTDLYKAVSHNPRMPDKLNLLENAGLLIQDTSKNTNLVRLTLTEKGQAAVNDLKSLDSNLKSLDNNVKNLAANRI